MNVYSTTVVTKSCKETVCIGSGERILIFYSMKYFATIEKNKLYLYLAIASGF